MSEESVRLRQARERYSRAVADEAQTYRAAEPARAQRAKRNGLLVRLTVLVAVLVAVSLVAVGWWARSAAHDSAASLDDAAAARSAAESAIVTMLTADPAHANSYVDAVLTVTTGDQSVRVKGARADLTSFVAALPAPTTGQIVSSGVVGTETDAQGNDKTSILVVAQTTNPQLVGGSDSQNRVGLTVSMVRVGDKWKVQQAGAVS